MPRDTPLSGGGLCGGVRYEISGALRHASHCHCSMCRKQLGAAFGSCGSARRAEFRWTAGESLVTRFASSPGIEHETSPRQSTAKHA